MNYFFNLAEKILARIVLLVTSDIIADQRIHRTAFTLQEAGHTVTAIGRRSHSKPKSFSTTYSVKLLNLPFRKGPLFYASYNIWAFIYLIFSRFDLLHANDLDTLLAGRLVSIFKRKPIIYDSHELFTEVPELVHRQRTKKIWSWLERKLVKGLQFCSTVSNGVAMELNHRYGIHFEVIRNLPVRKFRENESTPSAQKTIIYQGALNVGRGLEKLIEAMQWVQNTTLIIVGSGDIETKLKKLTTDLDINEKVKFRGRIPFEKLHEITQSCTLGVSIEEDLGLNYRYALPNKLFDYIQAGLPILTTNLPEMKSIVKDFAVGEIISNDCSSEHLAETLNLMLSDEKRLEQWRQNAISAGEILCWENEKVKLIQLVEKALSKKEKNQIP